MTKLSVNVNKLATLRNAREKNNPNLEWWGQKILADWKAHGLTVHPRPDGRHIRHDDVLVLSRIVRSVKGTEFNIEGYPSDDFFALVKETKPDQCTLVPDPPEAITSNAGWDFVRNEKSLIETTKRLKGFGARVSLFLEPKKFDKAQADSLSKIACDRVELYTEDYADAFDAGTLKNILPVYQEAAATAGKLGLGLNAGHDLNQKNLGILIDAIPAIDEVSIGHALICEALEQGFATTLRNYLQILREHGNHQ
jgi:pyridoxine 5-phosphate synthase